MIETKWILPAIAVYAASFLHVAASDQQPPAPVSAAAYKNLPEGAGKAPLVRMCSVCHELERVLGVRHSPHEWAAILENMSQRGAQGTDEEWDALFEYLSQHFGPRRAGSAAASPTTPSGVSAGDLEDGAVHAVFTLTPSGGRIEVLAVDTADAGVIGRIRTQLRDVAARFGARDFRAPAFIDPQRTPGSDSLQPLGARITYKVEEVPGGGRLVLDATEADAIAAVQAFVRAQQKPARQGGA